MAERVRLLRRAADRRLAAAAILRASLGDSPTSERTLPSGSNGQAFLWELLLTFFLMFVIMAVATDTRAVGEAAAIAIGGTVGLDAMFGGPVTGASMNPARSFGPALVSGELRLMWIYILAPLAGAALGALAYQLVRGQASPSATARDALLALGAQQIRRHAPLAGQTTGRPLAAGSVGSRAFTIAPWIPSVIVGEADAQILEACGLQARLVLADGTARRRCSRRSRRARARSCGAETILGDHVRDPDPPAGT